MYNNELLFLNKFMAQLNKLGIYEIPFNNDKFRMGVESMKRYYDLHIKTRLNDDAKDVKLLFLDNGKNFAKAIIFLDNINIFCIDSKKNYETVFVKMPESTVKYISEDKSLNMDDDIIKNLTLSFLQGITSYKNYDLFWIKSFYEKR